MDRQRERRRAGEGVATRLQRQSVIVEYGGCADRDQVLIEARCSMQCVVRAFLETSAHKPHRYISRYPEIFEKKSRLIVRKIRYFNLSVYGKCLHPCTNLFALF